MSADAVVGARHIPLSGRAYGTLRGGLAAGHTEAAQGAARGSCYV
ncbi:MAG: hypothetical protein WBG95_06455 [Sulfitobacter sp.]